MSDFDRPASEGATSDPPDGGPLGDESSATPAQNGPAGGGFDDIGSPSGGGDEVGESWTPVEPAKADRKRGGGGSFLKELPVLLLIAFVLAFLLRTFVVQVFYIPSSSMEPTLQINDRMVVEKVTYRFREPRRGEIAVFEGDELGAPPEGQGTVQRAVRGVGQFIGIVPASARDFVKRVVGLPGDEILIEGGQVFVNGEPLDEPYVVYDDQSDFGPVTVPEDRLFFLGDNRPNSSDSRRGLGFVAADHLVGRAGVIIWPLDHAGLLTGTEHDVPDRGEIRDEDTADPGDADEGGDDDGEPDTSASQDETTQDLLEPAF
jgi:signal peptidase I